MARALVERDAETPEWRRRIEVGRGGLMLLATRLIELEEQLEAYESVVRRFLEWDALTALPDPLPAPFGDLHYWLSEFRRTASSPASRPSDG